MKRKPRPFKIGDLIESMSPKKIFNVVKCEDGEWCAYVPALGPVRKKAKLLPSQEQMLIIDIQSIKHYMSEDKIEFERYAQVLWRNFTIWVSLDRLKSFNVLSEFPVNL